MGFLDIYQHVEHREAVLPSGKTNQHFIAGFHQIEFLLHLPYVLSKTPQQFHMRLLQILYFHIIIFIELQIYQLWHSLHFRFLQ